MQVLERKSKQTKRPTNKCLHLTLEVREVYNKNFSVLCFLVWGWFFASLFGFFNRQKDVAIQNV